MSDRNVSVDCSIWGDSDWFREGKIVILNDEDISMTIDRLQKSYVLFQDGAFAIQMQSSFSQGSACTFTNKKSSLFDDSPWKSH